MYNTDVLFDADAIAEAIARMAEAIIEEFHVKRQAPFALIGLHRNGVPLAERLASIIADRCGYCPEVGQLDISMYRDDIGMRCPLPKIRETVIPFDVDCHNIVLVDDVLSTGRTIRAALDAITNYGRPNLIRLAVLIDRMDSEFPIHANYIGISAQTASDVKLVTELTPKDSIDAIYKVQR